ncbi:MAG: LysM peptidoglycan-binding domain-containing protein [Gammaproteobacteria bacterium]|nr:LysM peptidoglycan-binding domain-containing protein [Gammaproteobacteria bacterium]
MTLAVRYVFLSILALVLVYLTGCSSTGDSGHKVGHKTSSDATFPVPPGIEDNVEFWRKVYGEMDRSQVVIHDNQYMGAIYEVVEVPAAYRGSGESRRAFVKGKQQEYQDRLATLERKLVSGESLTAADRELQSKLEAVGGRNAVFGASERVRTQQGMRERFRSGMEISGRYDAAFRETFRKHGVPEDLAFLPHVESSFQSRARSGVGAAGLWQFMPATGRIYDLQVDHHMDERMDPMLACEGAARYLAAAHKKLGSWPLAITSYNHGQGGMAKAKSLHGADIGKIVQNYKGEAFGFDSRNFYSQFVAAREVAGNPDKYFPEGVAYHKPHDHDRLVLRQAMPADQVARHYGLSVYQLDDLNPSWNNAIVQGKARIPAGASVWLPAGTTERITDHPTPGSASTLLAQTEREDKRERDYVTVRRTQVEPEPTLAQAETRDVARGKTSASNKSSATKAELAKNAKGSKLMLAKADTKGKAKADSKAASSSTPAKGQKGAKQVLAKADTSAAKGKDKAPIKTHVVKPNETLFRVAVMYDLSVDELKKLNKMSAKDNTIKAGQRIRVSG